MVSMRIFFQPNLFSLMVRFLVENIIMKSPVWYILIMSSDLQKWKLEGCLILHGGLVSKWERSKGTGIERAENIKAPTRAPICARGGRVVEKTVWRERDGEKVFFRARKLVRRRDGEEEGRKGGQREKVVSKVTGYQQQWWRWWWQLCYEQMVMTLKKWLSFFDT